MVRRDKRRLRAQWAAELTTAEEARDWRLVWLLARRLAGTQRGPKKRRCAAVTANLAERDDWDAIMSGAGKDGGMDSTVVSKGGTCSADAVPQLILQEAQRSRADDERRMRASDAPGAIRAREKWRRRHARALEEAVADMNRA